LILPSLPKGVVDFAQTSWAKFWEVAKKMARKRQIAFPVFS
jgi:hypothetical protein